MPQHARILVVDDDERFRGNLVRLLGLQGLTAAAVADGREALQALQAATYDVMLLDMKMPGMDGAQVLKALAAMAVRPEVIILSGHASMDLPLEDLGRLASDYLLKPCPIELVVAKIESAMERRRAMPEKT